MASLDATLQSAFSSCCAALSLHCIQLQVRLPEGDNLCCDWNSSEVLWPFWPNSSLCVCMFLRWCVCTCEGKYMSGSPCFGDKVFPYPRTWQMKLGWPAGEYQWVCLWFPSAGIASPNHHAWDPTWVVMLDNHFTKWTISPALKPNSPLNCKDMFICRENSHPKQNSSHVRRLGLHLSDSRFGGNFLASVWATGLINFSVNSYILFLQNTNGSDKSRYNLA